MMVKSLYNNDGIYTVKRLYSNNDGIVKVCIIMIVYSQKVK